MKMKTSPNSKYQIPCSHLDGKQPARELNEIESAMDLLESVIVAMLSEVV